jgi:predicted RNA-binding protein with PUA-like domain
LTNHIRETQVKYWLLKTEPDSWSWKRQVRRGPRGEIWSGVRNHVAKSHLAKMKLGDRALFYHSGRDKEVVGVVEVIAEALPDPTDPTGRFVAVIVKALVSMRRPISLVAVKREPRLRDMVLVNNTRLSVQPVTTTEWRIVCKMGEIDV